GIASSILVSKDLISKAKGTYPQTREGHYCNQSAALRASPNAASKKESTIRTQSERVTYQCKPEDEWDNSPFKPVNTELTYLSMHPVVIDERVKIEKQVTSAEMVTRACQNQHYAAQELDSYLDDMWRAQYTAKKLGGHSTSVRKRVRTTELVDSSDLVLTQIRDPIITSIVQPAGSGNLRNGANPNNHLIPIESMTAMQEQEKDIFEDIAYSPIQGRENLPHYRQTDGTTNLANHRSPINHFLSQISSDYASGLNSSLIDKGSWRNNGKPATSSKAQATDQQKQQTWTTPSITTQIDFPYLTPPYPIIVRHCQRQPGRADQRMCQ
ncbi:17524_t:CDS:2, partial [Acaulospora colombiana]